MKRVTGSWPARSWAVGLSYSSAVKDWAPTVTLTGVIAEDGLGVVRAGVASDAVVPWDAELGGEATLGGVDRSAAEPVVREDPGAVEQAAAVMLTRMRGRAHRQGRAGWG